MKIQQIFLPIYYKIICEYILRNDLKEIGVEMRKNKLALFTFALAAFNFAGKSSEKISLPKEYTENIQVNGF